MAPRLILLTAISGGLFALALLSFRHPHTVQPTTGIGAEAEPAVDPMYVSRAGGADSSATASSIEIVGGATAATTAPSQGVVSEWSTQVDESLLQQVAAHPGPGQAKTIWLRLSPDRTVAMQVRSFEDLGGGEGVFLGAIEGHPFSAAVLSYVGQAYAGSVTFYDERRSFQISATEDGRTRVTELDLDDAPGCTPPLVPQLPDDPVQVSRLSP